jgi:hypothetical protein
MQSAALSQHVTDTLSRADRLYETINDLFAEIKAYPKDHAGALQRYRNSKAAIPGELTDIRVAVATDRISQARAARYTSDAANVVAILDRMFTLMRAGKSAEAAGISSRPGVQKLGPEYLAAKAAFDSGERSDSLNLNNATRTRLQLLSTALVLLTVFGIVVTLGLAIGFGLRMGHRLRRLVANATLLARHKQTLPIDGDDEIAEVDRVYHVMSRELEETTVLQHALLPQRLPQVPGIRLDSAYVPAATHGKVGGDWFDVFPIETNLLGISIGDVAGHGLTAASRWRCCGKRCVLRRAWSNCPRASCVRLTARCAPMNPVRWQRRFLQRWIAPPGFCVGRRLVILRRSSCAPTAA